VIKLAAQKQASEQAHLATWLDAAIRELAQEEKGFLANITVAGSALDEIATHKQHAAPDDIARLGFAIAHQLNDSLPAVSNGTEELLNNAKAIASVLQKAKRPVIISGISCYNEGIIKAAFDIAAVLNSPDRKAGLAFVLPECNSMGLALMQAPSFDKAASRTKDEKGTTAIIIENDLYRYSPPALADAFFKNCENVIVLDSLHNRTTEKAQVLIPAATFAEGDGTLVNYEGRAQRFYQVYASSNPFIKESWKWLGEMQLLKSQTGNGQNLHPDKLLDKLETTLPQFEGISKVAPRHDYTIHGERIPREPHRYSGRTAMLANIAVSEPKPFQDNDSPLSFTMEGYKGIPPSSAVPFFWAPGWNSVQSVTKYQEEPGGSLRGGNPGILLFHDKTGTTPQFFKDVPEAFKARQQKWLLLPQYHVMGSGELSIYTKAVAALSPQPFIALSVQDAEQLKVQEGDELKLLVEKEEYTIPVQVKESLNNGLALVSAGLQGLPAMNWGTWVRVEKAKGDLLK
jgi:NADH-quinone oxidoreductase subunit G